ncbi:MAG: histidinol dehydrogenase [Bacteroidales bacterium]|nr:MAG: histidinol dehydrogenase [Bacteroidales bacterium]
MKIIKDIKPEDYQAILKRPFEADNSVAEIVKDIISEVKLNGDKALINITKRIDKKVVKSIEVSKDEMISQSALVSQELKEAIAVAIANIEKFHKAQLPDDVDIETLQGVRCMLKYRPLERVGLYIPGGTAPLISTLLMLAVPTKVAGCKELIACSPPEPSPEILYACNLLRVRLFRIGGAQAIAAMAYGTETIPKVDKLFGPGNRYVTEAKIQASSMGVPIDMPAGPSEVLIIADDNSNSIYVAADLLSQAEHGVDSQVILVATSQRIIDQILMEVEKQLNQLPRKEIASACLENSVAILVDNIEKAIEISNYYAPEHLILSLSNSEKYISQIENAGSVFLGEYSPESAGDYSSGTNHTLPTGESAKNWSGVTALSFMKTITFQKLSKNGLESIAKSIVTLARAEGLEAHARAAELRLIN